MRKQFIRGASILALALASGVASASEPVALNDQQMDQVAAGVAVPSASQMASLAALAWAHSEVTSGPGMAVRIDANFTARVGLGGSGTSFNHRVIFRRS